MFRPAASAPSFDAEGTGSPRWTLWVALTGLFATTFPVTVLALAVPSMAESFGTSERTMTWVITLPTLASALALPVLGKLGDLYGHRRVFLTGFAVATVTTALTATAWSVATLIAWRTVTQVIGGATQPSSLALINSGYRPDQRAKAMGWWSMVAAGAPVIGLLLGAPAIDAVGWQMLFVLQAAFMVVPVVAAKIVLRETPRKQAQFDVAGAVTLAVGIGGLMLAVSEISKWGATHPAVLAGFVVTPIGLGLFVWVERRVSSPLIPLEFFARRDFTAAIVASLFSSAAYMGAFYVAGLMMLGLFGYSASAAVPFLMVRPLVFMTSSPLGGAFATRAGNRLGALAGCTALLIGMCGLAWGASIGSIAVIIGLGFVFQGLGYGLLRPPISAALANSVDQHDLGIAGASERLMSQVGVAFGITVLASTYDGDVDRFAPAFLVAAVFAILAGVASAFMRRGPVRAAGTPLAGTGAAGPEEAGRGATGPGEAGRGETGPGETDTTLAGTPVR